MYTTGFSLTVKNFCFKNNKECNITQTEQLTKIFKIKRFIVPGSLINTKVWTLIKISEILWYDASSTLACHGPESTASDEYLPNRKGHPATKPG
jgi:hypothetical protein